MGEERGGRGRGRGARGLLRVREEEEGGGEGEGVEDIGKGSVHREVVERGEGDLRVMKGMG